MPLRELQLLQHQFREGQRTRGGFQRARHLNIRLLLRPILCNLQIKTGKKVERSLRDKFQLSQYILDTLMPIRNLNRNKYKFSLFTKGLVVFFLLLLIPHLAFKFSPFLLVDNSLRQVLSLDYLATAAVVKSSVS